jgi:hypothetical protein
MKFFEVMFATAVFHELSAFSDHMLHRRDSGKKKRKSSEFQK